MIQDVTLIEKFFKVTKYQSRAWGKAEKSVLLGWAESEDSMIQWTLPDMPVNKHEVLNWDKPREKQKWEREEFPEYWTPEYLDRQAEDFLITSGKSKNKFKDVDFFRDENNLTKEQYEYGIQEWKRRREGIWIFINGTPTYITGFHYFYLQHFSLDNGFPKYRDRDRRWFYAWQSVYDDPFCVGMVYLKHRRDGATYRCSCVGLDIVTRGDVKGKHFGITSKSEEDAAEVFNVKILEPFKLMVPFFVPKTRSNRTTTSTSLEFNDPPAPGIDKFKQKNDGLGAWIKYRAKSSKGDAPFDGAKLHFSLNDEAGKRKNESILELLRLLRPAMRIDGRLGKMLWPSTNEELEGDNRDEFETLWDQSDPAIRLTQSNKSTKSKLLRYFTPAYDGFDEQWFGPFGESIIHAPTPEQQKYLIEQGFGEYKEFWDKGWGGYEWCVSERENASDVIGEMRQIPFTPKEAFAATNPDSDYNINNLNRMLNELKEPTPSGGNLYTDITQRGNLEWVGDQFKGQVKFVPNDNGRFLVNKPYMPGTTLGNELRIDDDGIVRGDPRNYKSEEYGLCKPGSDTWIVIGTDPQKTAKIDMKKSRRYSSAAAHGFYKYRFEMEKVEWSPQLEKDPAFAKDWKTHVFLFEYICHPKNPREHHEDMLKACFFWNAKILFERQVNEIGSYFTEVGCRSFLITDKDWIKNKDNAVPGLSSSPEVIDLYKGRTKNFIDYHSWARRCPFPETIKQWIDFKIENIEKLDAQVSSGFALLAAQPGPLRKEQKKTDIANRKDETERNIGNFMRLYL